MFNDFFFLSGNPSTQLTGTYNYTLVFLSYLIASFASYVALDIARNLRSDMGDIDHKVFPHKWWLLCGSFTLGAGIWTMHFIGMEAFHMSMRMSYDPLLTGLSMICAIAASAIAFFIVTKSQGNRHAILWGGIIIGIGIASMHYVGMSAMLHVTIRYTPGLFIVSIAIAILASQVALWSMMRPFIKQGQYRIIYNILSAFILGGAICGMHYVGMSAAVFYPLKHEMVINGESQINPTLLSFYIGIMTILIMGISLILSTYRQYTLNLETKKTRELQQKEKELSNANFQLADKEKKTRAILTTIADGIITTDEQGLIQTSNPAAEVMFGFVPGKFEGQNIYFFIRSKSKKEDQQYLSLESLTKNDSKHIDLTGMRKGGEFFPLEVSVSKIYLTQGIHYVLTLNDITERTRAEDKLKALNQQLIAMARKAGMAQVANSVLHNVGNVLNSINVSISIVKERLNGSEMFNLKEAAQLFDNKPEQLINFLKNDPKGAYFPQFMKMMAETWDIECTKISKELELLTNKVDHIKHIIQMQQSLEINSSMYEDISIQDIIHDALVMSNLQLKQPGLTIDISSTQVSRVFIDKVKLLQILVNLIQNARDSVLESAIKDKRIAIKSFIGRKDRLIIEVIDNGIGIDSENLSRIFSFGFTTKQKGHGFGLNSSATSAQEMGGTLTALSEGKGHGATFLLEVPYQRSNENQ
jgi:PAS domain S-box-containing protein